MPELLNIFEKKEKRNFKIVDRPKIIADYRERNSLVASELISLGIDVEFKELKVADFIVNEVAIERKTVDDFLTSMINKRLFRQLEELQQYPKKLLLIEGLEHKELYQSNDEYSASPEGVHPNAIRGFLLSISLRYSVPIIFSQNYEDSARYIELLAKKKDVESSIRANKKFLSPKEQRQYILEGFPGIGPKSAKKLLKKFKTLTTIFNASKEDLEEILGKKAESFKKIIDG
ncbi:hypothetical protein COU57_02640 [Candidatus Pacearchaeota archaeon CG10_big_fil_rev_8_21_14_0_10_32_14]|nr:MAG: hypothetical protein COU57_02640 [Candidatus Pacearchaeota archaeon CG10_big_fil_rev_8_21_14_0_10_32_14]